MILRLIQYINFLTREGKSLLYRNYGSSDIDREFIKTFLNSIEEMSQSDIKASATEAFKYFYTLVTDIIIVVCTDLDDDDAVIKSKITQIKVKFIEKFGEILKNSEWPGSRSVFTVFERKLDDTFLGSIKVSIIGMGGCGKNDLVRLICGEDINLEYQPTINVDITKYDGSELGVNRTITLWDFAGQSNFRSLWKSLLDSTDIALLVMDSSFENVNQSKEIIRDILDRHYKDVLVIGIANKQDMPNRLTPSFIERFLAQTGIDPPIEVHGMIATNADYREKIHAILRDAINKISNTSESNLKS